MPRALPAVGTLWRNGRTGDNMIVCKVDSYGGHSYVSYRFPDRLYATGEYETPVNEFAFSKTHVQLTHSAIDTLVRLDRYTPVPVSVKEMGWRNNRTRAIVNPLEWTMGPFLYYKPTLKDRPIPREKFEKEYERVYDPLTILNSETERPIVAKATVARKEERKVVAVGWA